MIYLLNYPRSGSYLLTHMLDRCGLEVRKLHELLIYQHLPLKKGEGLVLLVRDFKECLLNHNFRRGIIDNPNFVFTKKHIDVMFGMRFEKAYRAMQYMENLVLFDMIRGNKILIHYEDLIEKKYAVIAEILDKFSANMDCWSKLALLDWDVEAEKVKKVYQGPLLSEGKGAIHHVHKIQYPVYLRDRLRELNPKIFDKYLKRYDDKK